MPRRQDYQHLQDHQDLRDLQGLRDLQDLQDRPQTHAEAPLDRRHFARLSIASIAAAVAGRSFAAPPSSSPQPPPPASLPGQPPSDGTLRIVHMNDWHVCPERRSVEGSAMAIEAATSGSRRPDLLLTGGDLIFDSFATTRSRAEEQWRLFKELMASSPVRVEHCLGNHDLWGWDREKSGASGDERDYGMQKALDELGLASSWRSFDVGGWHFVVLDSVVSDGGKGYRGRISPPQREWLVADLAANRLPVLVVSHIPILSLTPLAWDRDYDRGDHGRVSGSEMHLDGPALHRLFREDGRVRLCLSGHMHLEDRCEVDGIAYCCDGAVSGAWWKADPDYSLPGFAELELRPDGTFERRMRRTGWVNA